MARASLVHDGAGSADELTFRSAYLPGNDATVTLDADPGADSTDLDIAVSDTDITITLGSDAGDSATGTLTSDNTDVSADETVTIGDHVYTFVDALSTDPAVADEILIGANADETLGNLVAAINGDAGEGTTYGTGTVANTDVTAAAVASHASVMTAVAAGSASNAVATTTTATHLSWGAATLAGGGDNYSVTSTASDVADAVNADADASLLISAEASEGDGSDVPEALVKTALSGGDYELDDIEDAEAAGYSETVLDRGAAYGSVEFTVTLEKWLAGAPGVSGSNMRSYGQGATQAAAETQALAALAEQRKLRYGADTSTDSPAAVGGEGDLTFDLT